MDKLQKQNDAETVEMFSKMGVIITNDHFVYTKKPDGWYHGSDYVNKDALYPFVKDFSRLCLKLAHHFSHDEIGIVVGPTMGGIVLAQWMAYWLPNDPRAVYAEEENEQRVLKRGYDYIVRGGNCLVVEDIISSGGTAQKVIEAVRVAGGKVVGVGALCNRSGGKVRAETLGVPKFISLLDFDMISYKEDSCPICDKKGMRSVRTDLGHGKKFLRRNGILNIFNNL